MLIQIVDSHTEGEPTRVVLNGPDLESRSMECRASRLREDFAYLIRGTLDASGPDCHVVAFLGDPVNEDSEASVIFANRVEVLGMCVHGTIGVIRTLQHLGRIADAPDTKVRLDTPAGPVIATTNVNGEIAVDNVCSRRTLQNVAVELKDRTIHCDIAWGGNWFALSDDHGEQIVPENRRDAGIGTSCSAPTVNTIARLVEPRRARGLHASLRTRHSRPGIAGFRSPSPVRASRHRGGPRTSPIA